MTKLFRKSQRTKSRKNRALGLFLSVFAVPLLLPLTAAAKPFASHPKHYSQTQSYTNSALAAQYRNQGQVLRYAQKRISTRTAKSIAQKRYPQAKVIDIFPNQAGYRVRMQKKSGHVFDVFIDAATGRVKG